MLARQRQALILDRVRQVGAVRVADLVRELEVSDMTVRRDLEILQEQGLLEKVHGGATAPSRFASYEPGFGTKAALQQAEKAAIAAEAAAMVQPGMAIAISAGTTTYALAGLVADIAGVTVVTNSLQVADILNRTGRRDQTVILTGGVRTPSEALVGPFAIAQLRTVHLDLVFMGVHGMDAKAGFTCPNLMEADTDRALIEAGRRLVVLADHAKWGVDRDRVDRASGPGRHADHRRRARPRGARRRPGGDPRGRGRPAAGRSSPPPRSASRQRRSRVPTDPRRPEDAALAELDAEPHRRRNALTGEWVLVSAGRTNRPWLGAEEPEPPEESPEFDPGCYLCPSNTRVSGDVNPAYDATFVFTNDFAALRPNTSDAHVGEGLFRAEGTRGTCRVVCFSPRHDLTLAGMDVAGIRRVIDVWADQTSELGARYQWVQAFENRGAAMGASNPHPHGQIWSGDALPVEAVRELEEQERHLRRDGSPAAGGLRRGGAWRPDASSATPTAG